MADSATEEKKETQDDSKTSAQSANLSEAVDVENTEGAASINFLLDMSIPVTVVIGQTDMSIQKLLQLGPGSVLKLDKPIDAPADLYLRETKFAIGSIVVVDGRFAIRIKQIIGTDIPANAT